MCAAVNIVTPRHIINLLVHKHEDRENGGEDTPRKRIKMKTGRHFLHGKTEMYVEVQKLEFVAHFEA